MRNRLAWLLLFAVVALTGCATKPVERVVLLPAPDGKVGALVVRAQGKDVELKTAYAAVEVGENRLESQTLNAQEVQHRFGRALEVQPYRVQSFLVYFRHDSTQLTAESNIEIEKIKALLLTLPVPEIQVIGHTDQVGKEAYNDGLSLKRAEAVRRILISAGIGGNFMESVGRGKREPLVPSVKGAAEAKNRRVEIKVR